MNPLRKRLKYCFDYLTFKRLSLSNRFALSFKNRYPCLNDNTGGTPFDPHYLFHPAWAARIIARINPPYHVDISSSLHFCTMLSAFIPVKFYDFRPAKIDLSNLMCESADLTHLPFADNSISSLSCMHTLEHIGLGRYGDPINPDGDLTAIAELQRVLSLDGDLLIAVPIGNPKIMFNAHRIYSYDQIREYFNTLNLVEFSLIPDSGDPRIIFNATKSDADTCNYGCGCFWFKK